MLVISEDVTDIALKQVLRAVSAILPSAVPSTKLNHHSRSSWAGYKLWPANNPIGRSQPYVLAWSLHLNR